MSNTDLEHNSNGNDEEFLSIPSSPVSLLSSSSISLRSSPSIAPITLRCKSLDTTDQQNQIPETNRLNNALNKLDLNGILIFTGHPDDRPNGHHNSAENNFSTDVEEQQLQDDLEAVDNIEQQENNVDMIPPVPELTSLARVDRKQFLWFSKLPFFHKSTKLDKVQDRRLKLFEIFKFADKWDILLMIIGTAAALAVGVSYPVFLVFYQQMTNDLVNTGKLYANATTANVSVVTQGECSIVPNGSNSQSPFDAIKGMVKYYMIIGFLSIFLYWLAWASWTVAAERQVRRIRYRFFRSILHQEMGWFDMHNAGELSNRLIDDMSKKSLVDTI